MTGTTSSRRTPVTLLIGLVVLAIVLVIAFVGQDDGIVGGPGDPDGTGPDGLLALRLLIEETGGSTIRNLGLPPDDVDVALLVFQPLPPINLQDIQTAPPEPDWEPLLEWVERGGVLITSVEVDGGPLGGAFEPDEDAILDRGVCTVPQLASVQQVRPREYQRVTADADDAQCFGDEDGSLVVTRSIGGGQLIRLGSSGAFTNRALDDAENGAFAARLFELEDAPTVGFLSRAPVFFEVDADGEIVRDGEGVPTESTSTFGSDQPIDEDGNPIGSGDSGLLDLIPRSVIATIIALAVSLLLYAIARGRRLGSPIEEPLPIELPSSSFVEAVGRSYGRVQDAPARSANILRADLRADIARRVGLPANTPTPELVKALAGNDELIGLLEGTGEMNDDRLVETAQELVNARSRMERGGVAVLATSDAFTEPKAGSSAQNASQTRKDMP